MQRIQDKELDQLFKDKLTAAEVEPPATLWANIEQQIKPKRKRFLPFYWMAAAVAVVAVTVGLLFTNNDKIMLQGKPEVAAVKPVIAPAVEEPVVEKSVTVPVLPGANVMEKTAAVVNVKETIAKQFPKKDLLALQPLSAEEHLKPITDRAEKVLAVAEVPIEVKTLAVTEIALAQVDTSRPVTGDVIEGNSRSEKNGINNIGDLVNFVVDKVDKREQKFLKFKTDDEDNSSLVAINIGIIKLNGKNKAKR